MRKIRQTWNAFVEMVNSPTTLPGRVCQCVDPDNGYACDRQCSTES